MSIQAIAAAFEQRLPAYDKLVLISLADHATPDGRKVYPAISTLVEQTGLNERTVRRVLRRLEREGLIEREDDEAILALVRKVVRADRIPTIYRLTFLPPTASAPRGGTLTPRRQGTGGQRGGTDDIHGGTTGGHSAPRTVTRVPEPRTDADRSIGAEWDARFRDVVRKMP